MKMSRLISLSINKLKIKSITVERVEILNMLVIQTHIYITDPTITNDFHSIQNASSYTNYLIVKNKVTNNWGFPTMPVEDKYSFEEMKKHMFKKLSENKWNVNI